MVKPELGATATQRIKGLVVLRDCVQRLIDQQMDDTPDAIIQQTQVDLNTRYDAFTAQYGLINSRGNANAFSDDSAYYLLCSLEILDENGALDRKADMIWIVRGGPATWSSARGALSGRAIKTRRYTFSVMSPNPPSIPTSGKP